MRKLLIFVLLLTLTGCTDFKEQKITRNNVVKIQGQILIAKKVTQEEANLFRLGAMKLVRKQGNIFGKTVREVIEEGKTAGAQANPSPTQTGTK